uniref:Putative secreted protein n=1 Tax=Amblyomma americanum TaxID=6943 RepID=A0A0C9RVP0_AMBAM
MDCLLLLLPLLFLSAAPVQPMMSPGGGYFAHGQCLRYCNPRGHRWLCPPGCECFRVSYVRERGTCLDPGIPLPRGYLPPSRKLPVQRIQKA